MRTCILIIVPALAVGLSGSVVGAATVFVDADQTSAVSDGLTWETAWSNLHDALNAALEGDQIWVAEGVYHPGAGAATFNLRPGISLYGGFDGVATDFASRNTAAHPTVLDGAASPSPAYHVVTIVNASGATVLDGFTIRNGRITSAATERHGAGVLVIADQSDSLPLIANCEIRDNEIVASDGTDGNGAGVGLVNRSGGICRATVRNSVFLGNTAARRGGGMSVGGGSLLVVEGCIFNSNAAGSGSNVSGGAVAADANAFVDFAECQFWYNSGQRSGGAVALVDVEASSFTDCLFAHNSAGLTGSGGAVFVLALGSLDIDRCAFVQNSAQRDGGAVAMEFGQATTVTNSLFTGNRAERYGGAIKAADGDVVNCTIANNSASNQGGGVWSRGEVHNTIVWGNESDATAQDNIYMAASPLTPAAISYCNVEGGVLAAFGTTSINAEPMFVDHDGADDVAGTMDDDLRIRGGGGSPCLDAGSNARIAGSVLDYYRRQRLVDDVVTADSGAGSAPIVDIGAVEFPCGGYCEADLDGNGSVDFDDLNVVLLHWTESAEGCVPGDVDGSGMVDFDDLNRLLLRWTGDCSYPGLGF